MAQYDFFEAKKVTFLGKLGHKSLQKKILNSIDSLSKNKKLNLLEIGTGKGALAQLILAKGHDYLGYEPSKALYEFGIKQNLKLQNEFVPPLKESDNTMDFVILSHVLEHMPNQEKASELLNEIHRVLKPKGRVLIIVPDFADMQSWFYEGDYTHQLPLSFYRLQNLVNDSDLKTINNRYIWGSWNWFPAYWFNLAVKLLYIALDPIINLLYPKKHLLLKLRTTFSRCIFLEAEK